MSDIVWVAPNARYSVAHAYTPPNALERRYSICGRATVPALAVTSYMFHANVGDPRCKDCAKRLERRQ